MHKIEKKWPGIIFHCNLFWASDRKQKLLLSIDNQILFHYTSHEKVKGVSYEGV